MTDRKAQNGKDMRCDTCGALRVGAEHIRKHAEGVMRSGENPRTAPGYRNTLAVVKGLHRGL